MQFGGPAAWKLRAALAATLVPTYGIYAGYELIEHVARPGAEEQIDNEKYEYKNRHWEDYEPGGPKEGQSLAGYLTMLNEIRREHPALHWLRNITLPPRRRREHHRVLQAPGAGRRHRGHRRRRRQPRPARHPRDDACTSTCPRWACATSDGIAAQDLITGESWHWGEHVYVRLGPETEPVHVVAIRRF